MKSFAEMKAERDQQEAARLAALEAERAGASPQAAAPGQEDPARPVRRIAGGERPARGLPAAGDGWLLVRRGAVRAGGAAARTGGQAARRGQAAGCRREAGSAVRDPCGDAGHDGGAEGRVLGRRAKGRGG